MVLVWKDCLANSSLELINGFGERWAYPREILVFWLFGLIIIEVLSLVLIGEGSP